MTNGADVSVYQVGDRAWVVHLYGEIIPMLYLTCTTITSIDLAHYGVSRSKDWVSVKCGISCIILVLIHCEITN